MGLESTGEIVEIVGIKASSNGRSCEEHTICGSILKHDMLLRFRKEQILIAGKEETAVAAYWITDGVERCKVGFLPRYLLKKKDQYDGKIAQVTEFLEDSTFPHERARSHRGKGICRACLVEMVKTPPRKRRRLETPDGEDTTKEIDETNVNETST